MSNYTTQVRFICEQAAGLSASVGFADVEQVIQTAISKVMPDYPIFDENYRNVLNAKILRHYYTREIGFETVGLWKLKLATKLAEIMPYYNQLYKSELLQFDPFLDVNYTRTHKGSGKQDSNESSTGSRTGETTGSRTGSESSTADSTVTSTADTSDTTNATKTHEEKGTHNSATTLGVDDTTTRDLTSNGTSGTKTQVDGVDDITDSTTSKTVSSSNKLNKFSDTPQGTVTNLESGTYLTNASQDTVSGTDSTESSYNRSATSKRVDDTNVKTTTTDTETTTNTRNETGNTSGGESKNSTDTAIDKRVGTSSGKDVTSSSSSGNNTESTTGTSKETTLGSRTGAITSTDEYLETIAGKMSTTSYMALLKEYRDTFLNIDMKIINELEDLFFGLW